MSETYVTREALQTALNGLQSYSEAAHAIVPRDEGRIRAAQMQIVQAVRALEGNVRALESQIRNAQTQLQRAQADLYRAQSAAHDSRSSGYGVNLSGYEAEVRAAERALGQTQYELRQQEDQLRQGKLLERQMNEAAAAFLNQAAHTRAFLDHDFGNGVGFVRDRLTALIEYESSAGAASHREGWASMQPHASFEFGRFWGKAVSLSYDSATRRTEPGHPDHSWWEATLIDQHKTLADLAARSGKLGGDTFKFGAVKIEEQATIALDHSGLTAEAGIESGFYLARFDKQSVRGSAVYDGFIGGELAVKGGLKLSATEVIATFKAEAFAGAKAEMKRQLYSGKIAGVDAKVTGAVSVSCGIGGKLDVHAGWQDGQLKFKADTEATLGLGLGAKFDVSLDAGAAARSIVTLGSQVFSDFL